MSKSTKSVKFENQFDIKQETLMKNNTKEIFYPK
jgi:hypothetical protein